MQQFVWQRGVGAIPLLLTLEYEFVPVSGLSGVLSPTVDVVRALDDYFLDWNSYQFVSTLPSGGIKFKPMAEASGNPGLYKVLFNLNLVSGVQHNQIYHMQYKAFIPSGFYNTITQDINLKDLEMHTFLDIGFMMANFINRDV